MVETVKRNVAVLFGGRSAEHEISIITGLEIIEAIDRQKYTPVPVYINGAGVWYSGSALLDKNFYSTLPGGYEKLQEVALLPKPGLGGLIVTDGRRSLKSLFRQSHAVIPVDVYFPAFHGQFGEDGCIQGLLEMADAVYTGCGVLGSAAAMNKYHCKSVLHAHGIPVLPASVVSKQAMQKDPVKTRAQILSTKGLEEFPLFVKPVNLGSSIGVSSAADAPALDAALAKVFQFDAEALVEPCVTKLMEINVSVMEGESGPTASVVEIPVASSGILTYEDKYLRKGKGKKGAQQRIEGMAGLTRVIDPEDLDPDVKNKVIVFALEAFRVLGCAGVVRFDFIMDLETGMLYFNELNPLPGSMAHYLWAKSNPPVIYTELISRMIERAVKRKNEQTGLRRDLGFRALAG